MSLNLETGKNKISLLKKTADIQQNSELSRFRPEKTDAIILTD